MDSKEKTPKQQCKMCSFITILTNKWDVPRKLWYLCLAFRIAANLFSQITMLPCNIISQTEVFINNLRVMMIGTSQKSVALTDGNSVLGILGYHINRFETSMGLYILFILSTSFFFQLRFKMSMNENCVKVSKMAFSYAFQTFFFN